ncbi:MAG: DNA primase [Planctomycetota bacterium]
MNGRISQDSIEAVQRAADIVEVVSGYFPLRKAGQNFKACCPFHEEKTPSFMVHPGKQMYYCFGCKAGGSVFTFLMKMERLEFPEAVRTLAKRFHIVLKETTTDPRREEETIRAFKILAWAAAVFHRVLKSPEGAAARTYAVRRGWNATTVDDYRMGLAPLSWDFLLKEGGRRGVAPEELTHCGLLVRKEDGGGFYDRFRGRFMFPIADVQGRIVGFGGRTLGEEEPKYLNSPETPYFSKGRLLYGLDRAKAAMTKQGVAVITEGYTDVIAAQTSGIPNVVATLGTSLSRDHIRQLRRFAERIILVYDSDAGGDVATERGLEIFLEEDVEAAVADLPEGKDPADVLAVEGGAEVFRKALENAMDLFDFKLLQIRKRVNLGDPAGVTRAADEILGTLAKASNPVRQAVWLRRAAGSLGVPVEALERRMRETARGTRAGTVPGPASGALRGPAAAPNVPAAEEWLVSAFLHQPALLADPALAINPEDLSHAELREILTAVKANAAAGEEIVPRLLATFGGSEALSARLVAAYDATKENADYATIARDCLTRIAARRRKTAFAAKRTALRDAEGRHDEQAVTENLEGLQKLLA